MKNILLLASLFAAGNVFSQTADWMELGTKDESTFYYKPHSRDKAWIKITSPKLSYIDKTGRERTTSGYHMNLWQFDCDERKIGLVQSIAYDNAGKLLQSTTLQSYEIKNEYVIPNTVGEGFLEAFCEGANTDDL